MAGTTIYRFFLLSVLVTAFVSGKFRKRPLGRQFGNWQMVFRAESGNGQSVVNTYMTQGLASERDSTTLHACISLDGRHRCHRHYRHSVIDCWNSQGVKQVMLALYSKGIHVAHVIFDGRGSTATNWLAQKRVISSSWTDLRHASANFFSFFGRRDQNVARRLYMNHSWKGCNKDEGWLTVIESRGVCSGYGEHSGHFPIFRYSSLSTLSNMVHYHKNADVLAIYISRV